MSLKIGYNYVARNFKQLTRRAFSDIPDADLNAILSTIMQQSPNAGETYMQGSLRSRGIKVQRWLLRERLQVK